MQQISVIIPTYNPGSYLIECLNSLYNQTLSLDKFEIIIILNGNIGKYRSFLSDIYNSKPKELSMYILESEIPGVSRARNIGINKAIGKYLFFLDDDDLLSNNYFEDLLKVANENSIIASNLYSFYADITEMITNYLTYRKKAKTILGNRKYLSNACCKLIPREILSDKRFNTDFANGEDALFMFSISNKIKQILIEKDCIYYRRLRPNSASRKRISFTTRMKRIIKQQLEYTKIYFSNPFEYNLFLYLSRLLAVYKQ